MRIARTLLIVVASALPASAQSPEEVEKISKMIIENAECRIDILRWNAGMQGEFLSKYGDFADDVIGACGLSIQARESLIQSFLEKYPGALSAPDQ
ncbi:hypothetical protein [Mameliella sp. MMSF_3455]|uniref:hypothetical protein n=1 Tax=Mameliella sp. MMSF_3455 TaxID=3046714 RepID=UPI00273D08DE|nr:hypothetical protein [Mameliella sp. MMSF_3455]